MKHLRLSGLVILALLIQGLAANAQVTEEIEEKVERKVDQRIDRRTDQAIDKGLDKLEEGIGKLFGKKKKKKSSKQSQQQMPNESPMQSQINKPGTVNKEPKLNWSKYDFIPGEKIIFEDDLVGEENGEFPSRWDLYKGNVEIAEFGDENVIMFLSGGSAIIPYLKNSEKDYLPDIFTIEMDLFFNSSEQAVYSIILHDLKNQKGSNSLQRIQCLPGGLKGLNSEKTYTGLNLWNKPEKSCWRHISIGFNTRALKAYYDDERLINIPHLDFNPTGLTIGITNASKPAFYFVKNIRIAEGGQKLYDKFLQDGKIIANGIRFDVNKATLKPESMGIINEIADMMRENPDIKFSVEGHTDNDGDDALNQTLSEKRAATVVGTLEKMGIAAERLTSKGWGESKPLDTNNTPEGKANNRRVEFVKI